MAWTIYVLVLISLSGRALTFTRHDLELMAAAYDPGKLRAPLVIGHPRNDSPAYGWVERLKVVADRLIAYPADVASTFAELVNAGRYKKISASFLMPDSPSNPVPGVYYLRHVGFLDAQPPAVKGLGDASFMDDFKGCITMNGNVDFQVPPGYTVDPASMAVHQKAVFFMERTPGIEYMDAVEIIEGQ